jgi:hypothetical protein
MQKVLREYAHRSPVIIFRWPIPFVAILDLILHPSEVTEYCRYIWWTRTGSRQCYMINLSISFISIIQDKDRAQDRGCNLYGRNFSIEWHRETAKKIAFVLFSGSPQWVLRPNLADTRPQPENQRSPSSLSLDRQRIRNALLLTSPLSARSPGVYGTPTLPLKHRSIGQPKKSGLGSITTKLDYSLPIFPMPPDRCLSLLQTQVSWILFTTPEGEAVHQFESSRCGLTKCHQKDNWVESIIVSIAFPSSDICH